MSIRLDTDLYLLCNLFNISSQKIANEYSGMTIEEIMATEAKQGNTAAANFDNSVLTDPVKLIELFQLEDPSNKFAILRNMSDGDMEDLLPLLKPEDLVMGLNFFTKDKLLDLAEKLPIEQLINMTLQMFSPEQLMQLLPEEQLNKILKSTEIDKNLALKYMQSMPPEILAQMYEATLGQSAPGSENAGLDGQAQFDVQSMMTQFTALPDDKFQESMLNIPEAAKREFVLKLTKDNPNLFKEVSPYAYTAIINNKKEKEDIIKSANVLDPKYLVKMVQKLPKELTAVVLTQINTKVFAEQMLNNFKKIIREIVAG